MSFTSTSDAITRIKPKLVIQTLGSIVTPETEVMTNVFRKKRAMDGDQVAREINQRAIKSIPYTGQQNPGVTIGGAASTTDAITVPPMKCHHIIQAKDIKKAKNLKDIEFKAWLREELQFVRDTITANMEWYARHFLATGNCDYPFLVDDDFQAIVYSLGTMSAASGAPSVLFSDSSATLSGVIQHLDHMFDQGKAVAYRNHFQDKSKVITYARTAVWNAIYDILDGKQSNNVVTGRRLTEDDMLVGPWTIRKFDADYIDPSDQSTAYGIPAKKMRMVDTGISAPHTMAALEIENTKHKAGILPAVQVLRLPD